MTEANVSTCKTCLDCKVAKDLIEFNRDKLRKDGLTPYCKVCVKVRAQATYEKHREKHLALRKADYEKNKDAYKKRAKKWAEQNPEKRREVCSRYHYSNLEKRAGWGKESRKNNPGMYAAHYKMRQQKMKRALSPWADLKAMEDLYIESARLTKETGIKHHVDHFYPLTSDIVCGLHNQFNLRVIPARENLSKANSFPT